ncbi:MAG TPA: hypothetical protein PK156_19785 [Polyangium sp.]|nr:hypothetical protein [Polyangium sp.]
MNRRTRLEGRSLLRWTVAFSALASVAACGAEAPEWVSGDADESQLAPDLMTREGSRSSRELPAEVRAAYIRSVQKDAPAGYVATSLQAGEFRLTNPAQSFDAKVDREGVEFVPTNGNWSFSLRTTGVGCEGRTVPSAKPTLESEDNRIRFERPEFDEWYLNGPLGIEQGFYFEQPLECAGTKVIEMQTGGDLRPELDDADGDGQGETIRFVRPDGAVAMAMAHLFVRDADSKQVPAWLSVDMGKIAIHIDDTGAKYPLDVDPLITIIEAKILNPGGLPNEQFGYGLAFSGNTIVVGAPKSDEFGTDSGSAYVFVRQSPGVWVQQGPKLVPSDGRAGQWFGFSVGLAGDTALITAPYDSDNGVASGSAYVFVRNGGVWTQQAKLKPAEFRVGDVFGISGAISGDRVIVGAHGADSLQNGNESGAAFTFTRTGTTWTQDPQKIIASDGKPGELFGATVAISGRTIGIGAVYDDDLGFHSGSMYMFDWNGTSWVQRQKLLAPNGHANDIYGYWAVVSGDTMIVSAALYDSTPAADDNVGAAFVYANEVNGWTLKASLFPTDRRAGDWFGSHVALEGNALAVGAQQTDEFGVDSGSAYWYVRDVSGNWTLRSKLLPSPGAAGDRFGWTVGVSGELAAVGAPFDDTRGTDTGAVYIFSQRKDLGDPCNLATECATGICVDGVCCDTVCGNGSPNDCQACSVVNGGPVNGTCLPILAGFTCRNSTGTCDPAETCNGIDTTCPNDRISPAGTECRASMGACDPTERCDGASSACPGDTVAPAGTMCRDATGSCDIAEVCNGVAPTCPQDGKVTAGTTCRASNGACDIAEACDGINGTCPQDGKVATGTECRASQGSCDSPEVCDGATDACPNDTKIGSGTVCRISRGACDNPETCDGASNDCPVDTKLSLGTLCRPSLDVCDQPETCDGVSDQCPTDSKAPAGVLCRVAAGDCDLPEVCDGLGDACPVDKKPNAGTVCRASAGLCDMAETCDGVTNDCPTDGKVSAGQVCRLAQGLCDEFEFCDGTRNDCPEDKKTPEGVFCRAPSGLCDEPETCDGKTNACPADELTPNGILCRPATGACDVTEVCTGLSAQCPVDKLVAAGVECRQSQGTCDIAEECDGTNPRCPEDGLVEQGIPCRASGGECDQSELCSGRSPNCPADENAPDGTVCSAGTCKEGVCTEEPPVEPKDFALYGGGPLCQLNGGVSSSSSHWSIAFLALALGTLRRRFRSAKH